MQKIKLFIIESAQEVLYKITWPVYKDLQNSSILVLVASFIFAIIIGLIDMAFRNFLGWFYNTF